MRPRPTITLALLGLLCSPVSSAPPFVERRPGLAQGFTQADAMIPGRRLGVRAALVKRARLVIPDVVIVRDAGSYLEAVGAWTPGQIFPVLWDDGSPRAQEDISRFVRAFEPRSVVRFESESPDVAIGQRASSIREAWALAVGIDSAEPVSGDAQRLREAQGVTPPGLVLMNASDPAWPAGLALSAGRFEPIRFVDEPRGSVSGALSVDRADKLAAQIELLASETGLTWDTLGDDLDALTICLDGPIKIRSQDQPRTFVGLTDRIGRLGASGSGARWAWCGQVTGNEPVSAYRAMCSLFLGTSSAWVFDSYPPTAEWAGFDGTKAVEILEQFKLETTLFDAPRQSQRDWRMATLSPLDAGLVLVNTKGNVDFFELDGGRGGPGDAPILAEPAVVHFVHSWSLARAGDRNTVGGRWLERGAYAYLGSVQEPFLQAFVPTPARAGRFASGFAWGAAARVDSGPVWKLALLGDPLTTMSLGGVRTEDPLPIKTVPIDAALTDMLKSGSFADAIRTLTLLGRDADAARLARGLLKDRPDDLTPGVASAALPALVRAGENESAVRVARLIPDLGERPILLDLGWLSARALVAAGRQRDEGIAFMRANIRKPQLPRDAEEIGMAIRRSGGGRAAGAYVNSLTPRAANEQERKTLERLAADFIAGRR